MKFIFVNRFYAPDISATSQLLSDAASHLAESRDVHVVTSRLSYEGHDVYSAEEVVDGVCVQRIWSTRFGRGNLAGRACDYLTFYLSVFFRLLALAKKRDVVIAKTDPPMLSIPVSWAASIKGAMLVNWLQDLFPEVATALGMKLPASLAGFVRAVRNTSLTSAEVNIAIGDAMRNRILKEGVNTDRVVVVPNWSDGEAIVPKADSELRREWQLEGKFVVGYSGNFGRAHEYGTLATAIGQLRSEAAIRFLMVGGGVYMDQLRSNALPNCEFKPYQPREKLPDTLTLPDVHLVSLLPELEGLILPSKVYGILAAGRPIINIGDPQGEVGCLVSSHGLGFNVAVGDVGELVRVVQYLAAHPEDVQSKGHAARRLFEEQFGQVRSLRKHGDTLCRLT